MCLDLEAAEQRVERRSVGSEPRSARALHQRVLRRKARRTNHNGHVRQVDAEEVGAARRKALVNALPSPRERLRVVRLQRASQLDCAIQLPRLLRAGSAQRHLGNGHARDGAEGRSQRHCEAGCVASIRRCEQARAQRHDAGVRKHSSTQDGRASEPPKGRHRHSDDHFLSRSTYLPCLGD
jgi:hypothetical protein